MSVQNVSGVSQAEYRVPALRLRGEARSFDGSAMGTARPFSQWRLPSGPADLRSARHSTWQRVLVSALFAPVDASSLGGVSVVRRVSTSRINCSGGLNCFRSFATYARNRSPTARSAPDRFLSLGAGINPKAAGRFWVPPEDKFARQFSGLTGPSLDFPD